MSRAISLLIATMIAAVLIGLAAPSLALRAEQRLRTSMPFMQANREVTCRAYDPSLVPFEVDLGTDLTPGRVIALDDGTLAVLLVVNEVNEAGRAEAIDFATSLRVPAIILHTDGTSEIRTFDPPIRNAANLRAPEGETIDAITFCYQVNFPAPPKALPPGATVEPTPAPEIEPTATELVLDVSVQETAEARAREIAATATAAAEIAAADIAAAETRAAGIAASATAAAAAAEETVVAQQTAIAAAEAEAIAAEATLAAFEATLTAPTPTPTPEPTSTRVEARVAFETEGAEPFAAWDLPEGWRIEGDVIVTEGSAPDAWLVVPAPTNLDTNMAVEIEFRITGGDLCPRNFGVGVRMSENSYVAGGVEWACAPVAVLWLPSGPVAMDPVPDAIDLTVGWHSLTVSAFGDVVTVAIDGVEIVTETILVETPGRLIAIWSDGVGLEIRSVTVFEAAP